MKKLTNFFSNKKRFFVIFLPAIACLLTGFFLLNYFLPVKAADLTCQEDPEAWYLNRWPDVKASAYGQIAGGGLRHFCENGKNEGPRENCFDRDACGNTPPEADQPENYQASLVCQTDRLFHSVINYNGRILVGSYSKNINPVDGSAKLYDCTSGQAVDKGFPVKAESILDMEEYNGAVYMSIEHGNFSASRGRGNARLYKYSGGSFSQVYENSNWSLMLDLQPYDGLLYSVLASNWNGSEIVKCNSGSCSSVLRSSSGQGGYWALGTHNNEFYATKLWGSAPGTNNKSTLSKITGTTAQELLSNSSTNWGYQALTSYKGSLYYSLGSKIYRYPNAEVANTGYPISMWMGVSGDCLYAAASQQWVAQSGSSALYKSCTGDSGSWKKVADIDMVHIFRGYFDSSGTLYLAGGQYGKNGKVYKVSLNNPLNPVISSFTASPSSITVGQTATLSWSVSNATSISISGLGVVSGTSRQVTPAITTTYTLTATNASGSVAKSVTITVGTPPPTPSSTFRVFTHNPVKHYMSVFADGNTIYTGTYADNIGSASTYYSHFTSFNTNHQQISSCSSLNAESFFRIKKFKGSLYATVEHGNYGGNSGGPKDRGGIWKFDNGSWQFKHAIESGVICLDMVTTASNLYAACQRTFVVFDGNSFQNKIMPNGSTAWRLAELNGKVYIAANTKDCDWGCGGKGVLYVYNNGSLTAINPPANDLSDWSLHGITAFKDKIYVATTATDDRAYIYRYDPANGSFTQVYKVNGRGITHWMGTDGNYIYAGTGKDDASAYLLRSADGSNWQQVADLAGGLVIDGAVDANGYMYIAGGKWWGEGDIWWNGPTTGGNGGCSVGGGGCGASCNDECKKDPSAWYLNRYSDVKNAGIPAIDHFCANGKKEGRENCFTANICDSQNTICASNPNAWYLNKHSDVKNNAYYSRAESLGYKGGLQHFCHWGYRQIEGPRANCFSVNACHCYGLQKLCSNGIYVCNDEPCPVDNACASNPNAWYLNKHSDVKNNAYYSRAESLGYKGGLQHFCHWGYRQIEGPRANCFAADACHCYGLQKLCSNGIYVCNDEPCPN